MGLSGTMSLGYSGLLGMELGSYTGLVDNRKDMNFADMSYRKEDETHGKQVSKVTLGLKWWGLLNLRGDV